MTPYQIMFFAVKCGVERAEEEVVVYFKVLSRKSLKKTEKKYAKANGLVG
jgi:hypothetical protein